MENECCICIQDLKTDIIKLNCNHCFHGKCIESWQQRNNHCPLCRTFIVKVTKNYNKFEIKVAFLIISLIILLISIFIISIKIYMGEEINEIIKNIYNCIVDKTGIIEKAHNINKLPLYAKYYGYALKNQILDMFYSPKKYTSLLFYYICNPKKTILLIYDLLIMTINKLFKIIIKIIVDIYFKSLEFLENISFYLIMLVFKTLVKMVAKFIGQIFKLLLIISLESKNIRYLCFTFIIK